ncbi:MAG: hypothetical protein IT272_13705 [Chitinophagales bacterium]|nr:hypothetical protein [Chitinophagales bacterium]
MKILQLFFAFTLFSIQISFAQNRIEIYVNGERKNMINNQFKVYNSNDVIEFRIFCDKSIRNTLVDSLIGVGCGVKRVVKNKITIFPPSPQEQRSTNKMVDKEFKTHFSKHPVVKEDYVLFTFSVNEIHACQGEDFFLWFSDNSKISKLNFEGYQKKYKFFLSI